MSEKSPGHLDNGWDQDCLLQVSTWTTTDCIRSPVRHYSERHLDLALLRSKLEVDFIKAYVDSFRLSTPYR